MNKILILITAFLLTIQFSNAQTEKGSQTLGFNFGFGVGKTNESPGAQQTGDGSPFVLRNNNFTFGPLYSYFIANGIDISLALNFASISQTTSDNNFGYPVNYHDYQFSGTLYARKYLLYKNKFGIRTGPYISYGKGTTNFTYPPGDNFNDNSYTSHNLTAGVKLEMVYYASKKFGFAATLANLQYEHYNSAGGNQLNQNGNNVSFYTGTTALQVSMFYTFGGKG
ncbi:hypothetical protein [Mucilaginibacter gotjawali]|nr:hypothetical protein [Mucilaginibacter gotjawali]MBB3059039.1 hypothetical protein [Mucilaginibacter gotjawali]